MGIGSLALLPPHPALFEGIHWGTGTVFAETRANAESINLSSQLLRELIDVDSVNDWNQWSKLEEDAGS